MQEQRKTVKYEAPRLDTYGKLQTLTKGTGGSFQDTDLTPKGTAP